MNKTDFKIGDLMMCRNYSPDHDCVWSFGIIMDITECETFYYVQWHDEHYPSKSTYRYCLDDIQYYYKEYLSFRKENGL